MKPRRVIRWAGLLLPAAGLVLLFLLSRPQPSTIKAAQAAPTPRVTKTLPPQAPLPPVFARFAEWAGQYTAAPLQARIQLEPPGLELARERRSELKKLIQTDPQHALELA